MTSTMLSVRGGNHGLPLCGNLTGLLKISVVAGTVGGGMTPQGFAILSRFRWYLGNLAAARVRRFDENVMKSKVGLRYH